MNRAEETQRTGALHHREAASYDREVELAARDPRMSAPEWGQGPKRTMWLDKPQHAASRARRSGGEATPRTRAGHDSKGGQRPSQEAEDSMAVVSRSLIDSEDFEREAELAEVTRQAATRSADHVLVICKRDDD